MIFFSINNLFAEHLSLCTYVIWEAGDNLLICLAMFLKHNWTSSKFKIEGKKHHFYVQRIDFRYC